MSKAFNLLDEPWLPVCLTDGRVVELGLLDTFARGADIVALAETTPPNLVAQYRLLLAITHRAMSRALDGWKEKDRARWFKEGLPQEAIRDYLEYWRDRFWLFHPEYPFMQVVALERCDETSALYPSSTVSLELFYGTEMFNQEIYEDKAWSPARTLRSLLGYFQFVPGGFFPGKKLKTSEKAGALANTAAVIPVGSNLAKTLCLCLHPAPGILGDDDLPAWERPQLSIADLRGDPILPTGPNDRYTRQSRAVQLVCEKDGGIRWLRFAAGLTLGEDDNAPDLMVSFRAGTDGLVRLTFREGRALWRDLPALVPNPSGESQPAAVLNHAVVLHQQLNPFEVVYQPLLVAGLASDQAKMLRWRLEQIALPVALVADADKALYLRGLVEQADALFKDLLHLAVGMLADILPEPTRKETRIRARNQLHSGPLAASYFAAAERALPDVLRLLGEGLSEQASIQWSAALRRGAQVAWSQVLAGMGNSGRALRADAMFIGRFRDLLSKHLSPTETTDTAKEALT